MTDTIDLSPKALLNSHGNYILQTQTVYDLLKFLWTAHYVPTNQATFFARIPISYDKYEELSYLIDPLLSVYKGVHDDADNFKTNKWSNILKIADDLYYYAKTAAGDDGASYYGVVFDDAIALINSHSEQETQRLQNEIREVVSQLDDQINRLVSRVDKAVQDLQDFDFLLMGYQTDLASRHGAIYDWIRKEDTEVEELERQMDQIKQQIKEDQKQYEQDVILATTAVSYAWIGIVGCVAAATVMGKYGSDAVKMKNEIAALKKLMADDRKKIQDDKQLIGYMKNADSQLQTLRDTIGPALTYIQTFQGALAGISSDLGSIKRLVDKAPKELSQRIAAADKHHVIDRWNSLANDLNEYQYAAPAIAPQVLTLDDYYNQL